eukprot:snap_masked-scaffold_25-processed-gene-3.39-mRNA-1 protein AED:1.00 eAED:1.00 QI:0/0/0/0/1/1/3/0/64
MKSSYADVSFISVTLCNPVRANFLDKRNRMMPATFNRLMNHDELIDQDIYVAMKKKIPGFDDNE